jgi:hypothetical protein
MLSKVKKWNPMQAGLLAISIVLISIAEMATSTATMCLWHEPDCPKELIK